MPGSGPLASNATRYEPKLEYSTLGGWSFNYLTLSLCVDRQVGVGLHACMNS